MIKYLFFTIYFLLNLYQTHCRNADVNVSFDPPVDLRITYISTFNDLLPKRVCSRLDAAYCFVDLLYLKHECMNLLEKKYKTSEWRSFTDTEYSHEFVENFTRCLMDYIDIEHLTTADDKVDPSFITVFEKTSYTENDQKLINQTPGIDHLECVKAKFETCLERKNCAMKLQKKYIHEIIPFCRFQTYEKLNLAMSEPSQIKISTKFVKNDQLLKHKIGKIYSPDLLMLPQKVIEIFQELTYGHLEAIKIWLLGFGGIMKEEFCDPFKSLTFQVIPGKEGSKMFGESHTEISSIPAETLITLETLTFEQVLAVKNVSDINPLYRWIICNPIIGISPSMKYVMNPVDDALNRLARCYELVNSNKSVKKSICDC